MKIYRVEAAVEPGVPKLRRRVLAELAGRAPFRWWLVRIEMPDGKEIWTQARHDTEIAGMAEDLLAVWLDVPKSEIAVNVHRLDSFPEGWSG